MIYNPNRLSQNPSFGNVSMDSIQRLLVGSQDSLNNAIGNLIEAGQIDRGKKVADLISSGGMNGLNEQEAQAKALSIAGGSIDPHSQKALDVLLQQKGKESDRKFSTSEREAGQQFTTSERLGRQGFEADQRQIAHTNAIDLLTRGNNFTASENSKNRANQIALQSMADKSAIDRLIEQHNSAMGLETLRSENQKELANINNEAIIKANANKANNKNDLTELDKQAIKALEAGEMDIAVPKIEESISDDMDTIWDRKLDDKSKTILRGYIIESLKEKDGASQYNQFGINGLKDMIYRKMEKDGITFSDPSLNPFEERTIKDNRKK